VLRPAPPSFVARTGQPFVILGVAGDHPSALTTELEARLDDSGPVRRLTPALGEDLEDRLKSLGLIALPEATWFGEPKARPASDHLAEWSRRLAQASDPGPGLVGLEVLNGRRSPTYYSGRWGPPDGLPDGLHVARRQQRFGASIWCLVDLLAGYPVRLLDLQAEGDRQRPCDLAWRLQAAIDAQAAQPQSYRLVPSGPHTALHLFSPLPAFAERRLALAGDKMHPPGCLFAFDLPRGVVDQEISKLGSMLWMSPRPDGQSA
jgi:hypothetical protein